MQHAVSNYVAIRFVEMLWSFGWGFKHGHIFYLTFVDVAWCCTNKSRLASFLQKFCAGAGALVTLVGFSIPNMSQHVATRWPNACNILHQTMLRYDAFKCCNRLAGACKRCWANDVGIFCIGILWDLDTDATLRACLDGERVTLWVTQENG